MLRQQTGQEQIHAESAMRNRTNRWCEWQASPLGECRLVRHNANSPPGEAREKGLPERTIQSVQTLLVTDARTIGRVGDDEAGRAARRDKIADRVLPKLGDLSDACPC